MAKPDVVPLIAKCPTVALVQAFVPQLAMGLNSPAWSVSCEAFFYSLWPRLVIALRSPRPGLPWSRVLAFWGAGMIAPIAGLLVCKW